MHCHHITDEKFLEEFEKTFATERPLIRFIGEQLNLLIRREINREIEKKSLI